MTLLSPIPIALTLFWLALGAGLLIFSWRRLRRVTSRSYRCLLVSLRACALLLLTATLLNPGCRSHQPDPERANVAVFVDASASMTVRDVGDEGSRLDVVRRAVQSDKGLRARLGDHWRTTVWLFANRAYPHPGGAFSELPGATAPGDVLRAFLDEQRAAPPAAVILISDGNRTGGVPLTDTAAAYAEREIPLHCVAVGDPTPLVDVRVDGPEERRETTPGEPVSLRARLVSTVPGEHEVPVALYRGAESLAERTVVVRGDGEGAEVAFTVRPRRRGTHVYRIALSPPPQQDARPETDVAYAEVHVERPERFRVLFLAAHLGWQYPFFRRLAEDHEQTELSAVLKTGAELFLRSGDGLDEAPDESFPVTAAVLSGFDVLVLDSRVLVELDTPAVEAIRSFVDRRGGGLLCFGPSEPAVEALGGLLPATGAEMRKRGEKLYLEVRDEGMFSMSGTSPLTSPPGPWLPPERAFRVFADLKPAAKTALAPMGAGEDEAVLAGQLFGAGRTAWLGADDVWRWAMSGEADRRRYRALWGGLVGWLASGTEPRLELISDGARLPVREPAELAVSVKDKTYEPAVNARVDVTVTGPDGESRTLVASSGAVTPGMFTALMTPERTGEHRLDVSVRFPDGETLDERGHFLAVPMGKELANPVARPDVLRDVARLTGGDFFTAPDEVDAANLALSPRTPTVATRREWIDQLWALVLALACLGGDWHARRRIGLA